MDQALLPYIAGLGLLAAALVALSQRTPNDAGRSQRSLVGQGAWLLAVVGVIVGALWATGVIQLPFLHP